MEVVSTEPDKDHCWPEPGQERQETEMGGVGGFRGALPKAAQIGGLGSPSRTLALDLPCHLPGKLRMWTFPSGEGDPGLP